MLDGSEGCLAGICGRDHVSQIGRAVGIAALALGLSVLGGCGGRGKDAASDQRRKQSEQAVPVQLAALELGRIEAVLRFSSNLEAEKSVRVLARAGGQVTQIEVEEGAEVERDQVLLRLQNDEQTSRLARTRAELALARRQYGNLRSLHAEGAVSDQAFDQADYDLKRLTLLKKDAERDLRYTVLRAPIAGVVTQRLVKLGDTLSVGQHAFDVVDFDSIVARVFVPEKQLSRVRPGLAARIRAEALPGSYRGAIVRIAPVVDPRTGTVKATVAIPRNDALRPGMFAEVELVTAVHEQALLLPKRALVYDNDLAYAFKLGDALRVKRLRVEPRLENQEFVEPGRGFARGDRVVVAGQAGLKHGSLVKIVAEDGSGKAQAAVRVDAENAVR